MYSEKDLKDAARFREHIHKEALEKLKKINPKFDTVIDRNSVESYFEEKWEYPGAWYLYVSIPQGYKSRDDLVNALVRDTLKYYR